LDYSPGTETILLVEDEEALRNLVAEMLGDLGYRVLAAGNGGEALELAKNCLTEIHILISDVLMPNFDGVRLAETLRRSRPNLKVLFISGDAADLDLSSSGDSRLDKPFTLKMLAAKVRQLLQD
jgi:two-component system, cell cycle sensor histidine kinase and response regulator CckA